MVSFIEAIILGVIQGVTEWLPISSSGHLVLAQELLGITQPLIFDIILHLGSLIALIVVFRKELVELVKGIIQRKREDLQYLGWIIFATIPIAVVGLLFNKQITMAFTNLTVIGIAFLFTAFVLLISRWPKKKQQKLTWRSTIVMGIMQAFALVPGVSRSGITISTGLLQGREREATARFAFFLFIPAIVGATILEFSSLGAVTDLSALALATFVTIIVGILSLRLLLYIIKKQKFSYFGWYCLFLGIVVLILA